MIKLPAYLDGFSSRKDRSGGVRFSTQELTPADMGKLQDLNGAFGWLVFKQNELQPDDIPKEVAEEKSKTPSRRLRATIFVLWEQGGRQGDPEAFYRAEMERFIEDVKLRLV